MDILWQELSLGFNNNEEIARTIIRLLASFLIGGIIGLQRERRGKSAGLKTHILVSLGATIFVLGGLESGMNLDQVSRVIQGIVTGIGFIGAGSILKMDDDRKVKGLTTAASIWVTAALGVIIGFGKIGVAIIATILTLIVLATISTIERGIENGNHNGSAKNEQEKP